MGSNDKAAVGMHTNLHIRIGWNVLMYGRCLLCSHIHKSRFSCISHAPLQDVPAVLFPVGVVLCRASLVSVQRALTS